MKLLLVGFSGNSYLRIACVGARKTDLPSGFRAGLGEGRRDKPVDFKP